MHPGPAPAVKRAQGPPRDARSDARSLFASLACAHAGFVLLGGVPISFLNILGITLNTAGGCWYAWIKYQQVQQMQSGRSTGPGKEGAHVG